MVKKIIEVNQEYQETLAQDVNRSLDHGSFQDWAYAWRNYGLYLDSCIRGGKLVDK